MLFKATFSCEVMDLWSHPCTVNEVAIGHTVVCYAWADHDVSAGVKCRHCILPVPGNQVSGSDW